MGWGGWASPGAPLDPCPPDRVGQELVDLAGSVAPEHLFGLEEPLQFKALSHFCCPDGSLGTVAVAIGPVT